MPLNLPNLVTWLRILLIPLIVGVYYVPEDWLSFSGQNIAATAIFIFAAATDWLDGYLARVLNQMSAFGAFLDPVADKLVVVAALIVLLKLGRVDMVVGLIIIGREIAISALREWMARVGQSKSVAVAFIGKVTALSIVECYKTIVQLGKTLCTYHECKIKMGSLPMLIVTPHFRLPLICLDVEGTV
jgi:CDP-diacylglycerol--glycerol-3-phosphate 3-phosphatidyltransferase/cardiolipin synthase